MTTALAEKIDFDVILRLIPAYDPFDTAEDCWFDTDTAQQAIDFFHECITHVKGALAGQPFILEPWQQAIVANLFGWKRTDGTRRYRSAFIFIPRKNGKTAMTAGLVLLSMFCDKEVGAELYAAAGEKEQATLLFNMVHGMVKNEYEMSSRTKVYTALKSIVFEEIGASFKALSADSKSKHGFNTHFAVIDELHVQPNRDLVDVLDTSTISRTQPMIVYLTTSDYERPSICNETYDYAVKVRDGLIPDKGFLPVIYEASVDDDWTDPAVWAKANPNLGVSVPVEKLKEKCEKAKQIPAFENTFKRLHLNIRTEQDVRWLPVAAWDKCGNPVDPKALEGRECYAGLDLSSNTDTTSLVLVFPDADVGYYVVVFIWIPKENATQRERMDKVPYLTWARQSHLILTDGDVIDYDLIRQTISGAKNVYKDNPKLLAEFTDHGKSVDGLIDKYNIVDLAIDRWSATQITTQLTGDGVNVVPFGQGFASMSAPTKELERLVLAGQIAHGGHPVMRWMAANIGVEMDAAENIKFSKKKATGRIDGMVSLVMAIGRAMVTDGGRAESIYEKRGPLAL